MLSYRLLEGTHSQDGRHYAVGDVVRCDFDLVRMFPGRFVVDVGEAREYDVLDVGVDVVDDSPSDIQSLGGGYSLRKGKFGRFDVIRDVDGAKMNDKAISETKALDLISELEVADGQG
jgi:hypothetical protein